MKRSLKELRIGTVIAGALAIMIGTVFFIGGKTLLGGKVKYNILFDSTGGLYEGDPVLLAGVEVGNVTRLWFPEKVEQRKILVEISMLEELSSRIREDTRARIGAASLVYGKVVELSIGSADVDPIPPGGMILTDESAGFAAIVDSTHLMVDDIRQILHKIDHGEGAVSVLLNESGRVQETLLNLSTSSQRLARLMGRLEEGKGPLGVIMSDSLDFRQTLVDVQKTTADLAVAVKNLKGTRSVAGKLINDEAYGDSVMTDLRSAVSSLASIAAKIDTGQGTLGGLINDPELYMGIQDVVLGVQKSSVGKWLIKNRRQAGEKERLKQEEAQQTSSKKKK